MTTMHINGTDYDLTELITFDGPRPIAICRRCGTILALYDPGNQYAYTDPAPRLEAHAEGCTP